MVSPLGKPADDPIDRSRNTSGNDNGQKDTYNDCDGANYGHDRDGTVVGCLESGAQFVKSSTGFGPPGADPRDIRLMRETVGPDFGVKASAGIRTAAAALELVEAGANRIGTSSGVQIMEELKGM